MWLLYYLTHGSVVLHEKMQSSCLMSTCREKAATSTAQHAVIITPLCKLAGFAHGQAVVR